MTPAKIYRFLREHRLAVISTLGPEASPQAAVIGIAVTEALDIIFDTSTTSRKYANLRADPRVALVIGWDLGQTVQIEGTAEVLSQAPNSTPANPTISPCGPTAAIARAGQTSPMCVCGRGGCVTAISAGRRRGWRS